MATAPPGDRTFRRECETCGTIACVLPWVAPFDPAELTCDALREWLERAGRRALSRARKAELVALVEGALLIDHASAGGRAACVICGEPLRWVFTGPDGTEPLPAAVTFSEIVDAEARLRDVLARAVSARTWVGAVPPWANPTWLADLRARVEVAERLGRSPGMRLVVGRHPGADVPSIEPALARARAGAHIEIWPGTYDERLRIERNLTIVGVGAPTLRPPAVDRAALATLHDAEAEIAALDLELGARLEDSRGRWVPPLELAARLYTPAVLDHVRSALPGTVRTALLATALLAAVVHLGTERIWVDLATSFVAARSFVIAVPVAVVFGLVRLTRISGQGLRQAVPSSLLAGLTAAFAVSLVAVAADWAADVSLLQMLLWVLWPGLPSVLPLVVIARLVRHGFWELLTPPPPTAGPPTALAVDGPLRPAGERALVAAGATAVWLALLTLPPWSTPYAESIVRTTLWALAPVLSLLVLTLLRAAFVLQPLRDPTFARTLASWELHSEEKRSLEALHRRSRSDLVSRKLNPARAAAAAADGTIVKVLGGRGARVSVVLRGLVLDGAESPSPLVAVEGEGSRCALEDCTLLGPAEGVPATVGPVRTIGRVAAGA